MKWFLLLVVVGIVLPACQRDEPTQPELPNQPVKLLRSIQWEGDLQTNFNYHSDSSVKERIDQIGVNAQKTIFSWNNRKLTEHARENSLYKNVYTYNAAGQITSIRNRYKEIPGNNGYEFRFQYQGSGLVKEMTYSQINEAGTSLVSRAVYTYSPQNELQLIRSYNAAGILQVELRIESYSAPCFINPWVFVSPGLHPLFQLYSYPVLASLKKLPAKIKQLQFNPDGSVLSTVNYFNRATITDFYIIFLEMETQSVTSPTMNAKTSGSFRY
jgi:hypothetical protein